MGYETRLYIGSFHNYGFKGKRVKLTYDFRGIPAGCIFNLWGEPNNEFFYLLDGDTRISLAFARRYDIVEEFSSEDRQYFLTMVTLDLGKVGHLPLSKENVICESIEFGLGPMTVDKDPYGTELVVYDPKAVLNALLESREEDDNWRIYMAIQTLENIIENAWQSPLGVICYGY